MNATLDTAQQGMHLIMIEEYAIDIQPVVGWEYDADLGAYLPIWYNMDLGHAQTVYDSEQSGAFASDYVTLRSLKPGGTIQYSESEQGFFAREGDIRAIRARTTALIKEYFGGEGWKQVEIMIAAYETQQARKYAQIEQEIEAV